MGTIMFSAAVIFLVVKNIIFKDYLDKTQRGFLLFSGIVLIFIFGMRNGSINYGTDLNNYYRLFSRAIEANSFAEFSATGFTYEKGYLFLNWVLSRIIKWPQFIIIFQASICIGITLRFIHKHSNDILISLLGFMSFGLMQFYLTGFRQAIAISICLIALEMAEKNRIVPFLLLVLLASMIHQTAIVFIFAYIFVQIPVRKLTLFFDVVLVLLISQLVPRIIVFGNNVFEKDYAGIFVGNSTGGLINIAIALVILLIMYLRLKSKNENSDQNEEYEFSDKILLVDRNYEINYKLMHIFIIGTGFYAMRFQALVIERISFYFTPVMFVLLPQIINNGFTQESRKYARVIFIWGMMFLIYWRMKSIVYIPFWA